VCRYDPEWAFLTTDETGAGLQHYELYDLRTDSFQMHNLYASTSNTTRTALHAQLDMYYRCRGVSCP
jgi:hypothetical protein